MSEQVPTKKFSFPEAFTIAVKQMNGTKPEAVFGDMLCYSGLNKIVELSKKIFFRRWAVARWSQENPDQINEEEMRKFHLLNDQEYHNLVNIQIMLCSLFGVDFDGKFPMIDVLKDTVEEIESMKGIFDLDVERRKMEQMVGERDQMINEELELRKQREFVKKHDEQIKSVDGVEVKYNVIEDDEKEVKDVQHIEVI